MSVLFCKSSLLCSCNLFKFIDVSPMYFLGQKVYFLNSCFWFKVIILFMLIKSFENNQSFCVIFFFAFDDFVSFTLFRNEYMYYVFICLNIFLNKIPSRSVKLYIILMLTLCNVQIFEVKRSKQNFWQIYFYEFKLSKTNG